MKVSDFPLCDAVRSLLRSLELKLGYTIEAVAFPPGSGFGDCYCAIGLMGGRYYLFGHENAEMNDALICHELLHLQLRLDGWTGFGPICSGSTQEEALRNKLADFVCSMLEHFEIYARMKRMGVDARTESALTRDAPVFDLLRANRLAASYPPSLRHAAASLLLANALLFPDSEKSNAGLREYAASNHPQIFQTAQGIEDACGQPVQVTAQTAVQVRENILAILGLPQSSQR